MAKPNPNSAFNERDRGSNRGLAWMGAAIVVAIVLSYAGTFGVPFLLDDSSSIVDNSSIRSLRAVAEVLAPPADGTTGGRPFLNLTFAVNYSTSGLEPWSYHAVNLLIHVLAALTLFGVVRRTLLMTPLRSRWSDSALWFAGMVALIWGVHPVQTQSVTYISQRAESLMGLFYLLTLYGFIRGLEARPLLWHTLAVSACLLGAFTKEVIVTAPLLVLLYDRAFVAGSFAEALRRRKMFYSSLAATWAVVGWMLLDVGRRGVGFGEGVSAFHYALTQCDAVLVYLKLCLWPSPLIFDRGNAVVAGVGQVIPQIIALIVLVAASAWAWVRHARLGFVCACFFLLLAPTSSVVPVAGATVAENRIYLPLAAVVVLVVWALHVCLSVRLARVWGVVLVLVAAVGTFVRNRDYQSAIGLWKDVVAKAPNNPRAHNNLALLLVSIPGRAEEGRRHYLEALRLKPDYADAHYNLALQLAAIPGRQDEALGHYADALRFKPDDAETHYNLANLLSGMPGRQVEALRHYAIALHFRPELVAAHYNLANLLSGLPGRQADAFKHYAEALQLKPDFADAHTNLASLLRSMPGGQDQALKHYAEALRLRPDHPEARNNLAVLLAAIPERQVEALAHFAEVLRLKPDYADAHYNLALLLAALPARKSEAIRHYTEVLRLKPDYFEAYNNLALLLAMIPGQQDKALGLYAEALRLKPNYVEAHNNMGNLLESIPGRQGEALVHYAEAARLLPDNPVVQFNYARQLERVGGHEAEAASLYRKAIALDPNLNAAREALERLRK